MRRIKGKDTSPEIELRQVLWGRGLRYRLHRRIGRSRPDLVFVGAKVAVFVDGCFWHGCPEHYSRPRGGTAYWSEKLASNVERDRRHTLQLEAEGWRVLRIWEHEILQDVEEAAQIIEQTVEHGRSRPREQWRVYRVEVVEDHQDLERRFTCKLRDADDVKVTTKHRRKAPTR